MRSVGSWAAAASASAIAPGTYRRHPGAGAPPAPVLTSATPALRRRISSCASDQTQMQQGAPLHGTAPAVSVGASQLDQAGERRRCRLRTVRTRAGPSSQRTARAISESNARVMAPRREMIQEAPPCHKKPGPRLVRNGTRTRGALARLRFRLRKLRPRADLVGQSAPSSRAPRRRHHRGSVPRGVRCFTSHAGKHRMRISLRTGTCVGHRTGQGTPMFGCPPPRCPLNSRVLGYNRSCSGKPCEPCLGCTPGAAQSPPWVTNRVASESARAWSARPSGCPAGVAAWNTAGALQNIFAPYPTLVLRRRGSLRPGARGTSVTPPFLFQS